MCFFKLWLSKLSYEFVIDESSFDPLLISHEGNSNLLVHMHSDAYDKFEIQKQFDEIKSSWYKYNLGSFSCSSWIMFIKFVKVNQKKCWLFDGNYDINVS